MDPKLSVATKLLFTAKHAKWAKGPVFLAALATLAVWFDAMTSLAIDHLPCGGVLEHLCGHESWS